MMIKKISYMILAALFMTLVFSMLSACERPSYPQQDEAPRYSSFRDIPGVTDTEIAAIENLQKQGVSFVYGTIPSTETFINVNGELSGFTVLLCEWLTELFGIVFEPELLEWTDMLAGLETGRIDFTGELTATEERREHYIMTDAIAGRSVKCMRIAGSVPLSYIAALRAPRYAFLRDTITYNEIKALSHDEFETFYVDSYEEAYSLLKSQEIDAFIDEDTGEAVFDVYGDVIVEAFYPLIYGPVSLATGTEANKPVIDLVQKILQSDGAWYLTELYQAGRNEYRKHKLTMSLTEDELSYIHNNSVVNFVAEYDNYPISFYNTRDEQWQGICFDVLQEVESLTGLTFHLVNDEKAEWPVILGMLENGEASIISELIRTPEREDVFLWPKTPLMTDNYALISKSEYRNITIDEVLYMKVALAEETAHAELFSRWFPNHQYAVKYGSVDLAFAALQSGEADLMMASLNQLLILTNYQELAGYKANIVFDYPFDSTFGFHKDDDVLCSIVEKSLNLVDTKGIAAEWTRKTYDYRKKLAQSRLPWLVGVIVSLLLILILLVTLFYKSRQKQRADMEAKIREQAIAADNAVLDRLNRMKSDVMAVVSHEARTPLAVLSSYAGLVALELKKIGADEQITADLDKISSEAVRIAELIENMNLLTRQQSDAAKKTSLNVGEVIMQTARLYEHILERGGVKLETDIPGGLPPVFGSPEELTQVVFNLLQNAKNHTISGSVTVSAKQGDGVITVMVSDTGSGIAPELLPRVFERNVSGNGGDGIGLSLCREIIKNHGGTITIESELQRGTVVTFTLSEYKEGG